jgi:hypothetical protein
MKNILNYIILFALLIGLALLYRRLEEKKTREENNDIYTEIQKYLLDDASLAKSKKPILWIHVPYEYNSRNWLSFGSRSSYDLNQPYLYLTVKSILIQCDQSFTICIIDDLSFRNLIPGWNLDLTSVSDPILNNLRQLGLMNLIYIYGGMICPISFVCIKDLIGLYYKGTKGDKMFLCETIDRNITSTTYPFYPNLCFSGANKNNINVKQLMDFMQRIISTDYTAQSVFLGDFNRWCEKRIQNKEINIISGFDIGTKTVDEEPIVLEDLMSQQYLNIYPQAYGILIPAQELVNRVHFEWFIRMSQKQVLESNTIIGNYLLLTNAPDAKQRGGEILEPLQVKPTNWVGFWKTPLYPGLYGQKPNFLGDNLRMLPYSGR